MLWGNSDGHAQAIRGDKALRQLLVLAMTVEVSRDYRGSHTLMTESRQVRPCHGIMWQDLLVLDLHGRYVEGLSSLTVRSLTSIGISVPGRSCAAPLNPAGRKTRG